MHTNTPLISIILCTFNRKRTLPAAIDSVLCQTHSDWELVIVDDGSRDGTERILKRYAQKEPRIRFIRQSNKGLALARNAGIRLARGRYVTFLDSDDEYTPRHIAKRMKFLRSHPDVDAVLGGMKIIGPVVQRFVPDVDHPGKRIHVSRCHAAGTLVVTRTILRALGGFRRLAFSEDYDMIKRLQRKYTVRRVSFKTYIYNVGGADRLCRIFEQGGAEGIRRFRRKGTVMRRA
ncbi:MAG: glycosyltransferase family 2 protein [Bacteroidota bacterium]